MEKSYRHHCRGSRRSTSIGEDEKERPYDRHYLVPAKETQENADGATHTRHRRDDGNRHVPAKQVVEQPACLEDVHHASHSSDAGIKRGGDAEVLLAERRERHIEHIDQPARGELSDESNDLHGKRGKGVP